MNIFKDHGISGMGMVEIMVALGLAGGLSLTVAKILENAGQGTKQFEAKTQNINLKGLVQDTLSNTQACINTFGPLINQSNMTTLTAGPTNTVTVPSIKDKGNIPKYATTINNVSPLTITSITLTNYKSSDGTADLVIQSTFKKSTSNIVSVKPMKIPITFNIQNPTSATPILISCSTSAVGGEWMLGGNAGTIDGQDYIGTSDNQPLNFRVKNTASGRITSDATTFFGFEAGANSSGTGQNTGIGAYVLRSATGSFNVAVGTEALRNLTTGNNNVALGVLAGRSLTTGSRNILMGMGAGSLLTTESDRLIIDNSTLTTPLIQGFFSTGTLGIRVPNGVTPLSTLTVGHIGTEYGSSQISGAFYRDVSGSGQALMGKIKPDSSNTSQIGVSGYCTTASGAVSSRCHGVYGVGYFNSAGAMGRTYGVRGNAGNGQTGYNYGVYGSIQGTTIGTAIFGTIGSETNLSSLYDTQSRYAGVFDGPVHMTSRVRVEGQLAVGPSNTVTGSGALALGSGNSVTANYATAIGTNATATHSGSLVLGSAIASTTSNQMIGRYSGGYTFYTSSVGTLGVNLATNATSWGSSSDRNVKWDIREIDLEEHLRKIAKLPVSRWKYKGQDIPHMGPMAQDFYYIFKLGDGNDKVITTQDMDGVTIAAVKGLEARTRKLAQENEALKKDNEQLKKRLERLEALILNK